MWAEVCGRFGDWWGERSGEGTGEEREAGKQGACAFTREVMPWKSACNLASVSSHLAAHASAASRAPEEGRARSVVRSRTLGCSVSLVQPSRMRTSTRRRLAAPLLQR